VMRFGNLHTIMEEDAVLAAAAASDPRAFAPLYERYLDAVYRYCYRRLGSREAAEDATSQVFYRAIAGLAGFAPARSAPGSSPSPTTS